MIGVKSSDSFRDDWKENCCRGIPTQPDTVLARAPGLGEETIMRSNRMRVLVTGVAAVGIGFYAETIFSKEKEPIRNDAEVITFLEKNAKPNSILRFQGEIRGYEQSMELWKINV